MSGEERDRELLERARRLLDRKPRTESELRADLERTGAGVARIGLLLERLRAAGLVDDRRLAEHFIATRSSRLEHGPVRLLAELERRGVHPEVARAAWDALVGAGDVDPDAILRERIHRARHGAGRPDGRARARLYNALLRAGFEPEAIEAALRREGLEPPDEAVSERTDDDIA